MPFLLVRKLSFINQIMWHISTHIKIQNVQNWTPLPLLQALPTLHSPSTPHQYAHTARSLPATSQMLGCTLLFQASVLFPFVRTTPHTHTSLLIPSHDSLPNHSAGELSPTLHYHGNWYVPSLGNITL